MGALRRAVSVLVVGGGPYGSTPVFVGGGQLPVPLCPLTGVQGPFPGSVAVSQVHLSITTLPSGSVRGRGEGCVSGGVLAAEGHLSRFVDVDDGDGNVSRFVRFGQGGPRLPDCHRRGVAGGCLVVDGFTHRCDAGVVDPEGAGIEDVPDWGAVLDVGDPDRVADHRAGLGVLRDLPVVVVRDEHGFGVAP